MPKPTYGPEPKERAKHLLDALLAYVKGDLPVEVRDFSFKWKDEDSKNPKLVIKTTLQALEYLTGSSDEGKLTIAQIRPALKQHFKDFLGILEDHRTQIKGKDDWHFTLTLWSKDRKENLKQFEIEWEKRRSKKSKEQEATLIKTVTKTDRKSAARPENQLYQALLKLDYSQQAGLFQYFVEHYQIGACLIHGSLEYGPRWLMNRLIQQVPNGGSGNNYVRKISFSRTTQNRSLDSICKEISRKIGITSTAIPEIAEKICQLWQSQTVILIFDNTHNLEEDELESFLAKVWQPLAELANKTGTTNDNYRLLLFLLDLEGCTNEWKINCTQEMTPVLPPGTLIKLQNIEPLYERELFYWVEKSLPVKKSPDDKKPFLEKTVVVDILTRTEGSHQKFFEEICQHYGITWEEQESTWLKY